MLPIGEIDGCHLVTIEGITTGDEFTPFQESFYSEGASQCGFCTPGMIMSLTGCLLGTEKPTVSSAIESLGGNICRCTGYAAVKRAVDSVMNSISLKPGHRIESLIKYKHIPAYFSTVEQRLQHLPVTTPDAESTLVAGGTDIYVHSCEMLSVINPEFLSRRRDLNSIRIDSNQVTIGSAVTIKQLRESQHLAAVLPGLKGFLLKVSSSQIRARATVGGNIVNASPVADLAVVFLALNADAVFPDRSLALHNFYLGYKKLNMLPEEILTGISFPLPASGFVLSSLKVSKREYLDIASVNSSMLLKVKNSTVFQATVSAGGVAPVPLLLKKTGEFLTGRVLTESTVSDACRIAVEETAPISDIRGSKEYKRELLKAQIRAHLTRRVGS
jgi:xanthine dehydrogenase small subunit